MVGIGETYGNFVTTGIETADCNGVEIVNRALIGAIEEPMVVGVGRSDGPVGIDGERNIFTLGVGGTADRRGDVDIKSAACSIGRPGRFCVVAWFGRSYL